MAPGPFQIIIVVLLILVVFGASRVPAIAENLAKGIKSFKKGLKDEDDQKAITKDTDKKND
ncbi:MAG: twin-arginine translocase TatA/TatE family subunit [Alphaproteobacteria bacterium]|nr:twin-arginine translocase TatA/TatE family subunit [Alphaproteobacteria bacterium]